MRIGIITPGGVDPSGTERVIPCVLWTIERLVRAGDEVEVFAFRQNAAPGEWSLLGARVFDAAGSWRRVMRRLAVRHRAAPFDVLYALWATPCGLIAGTVGRLFGIPVVLHIAGGDLVHLPEISYGGRLTIKGRILTNIALRLADRVLAPSLPVVQQVEGLGIPCERVPLGVALDQWPPRPPHPGTAPNPARLLHVGSLNRVKDQDTLLRAAARLKDRKVPFLLDIIGEDTLGGILQRRAANLGLEDCVTFHGFLPHTALRPWFDRADLLVVSSRFEAGPLVALEAAVAGLPVVGTAVGHLADWAPDAARVCEPGDAVGLAQAIIDVVNDAALRRDLAVNAQRRALAEDCDRTTARLRDICASLLQRRPGDYRMRQAARARSK
jgi:glycosyltransferase involved in cell wall biosynthesis